MDVNLATFKRELENTTLSAQEKSAKIATFSALQTAEGRVDALRAIRGGSIVGKGSTKLASVPDKR